MLILCRTFWLLYCVFAQFSGLTASSATVRVDVPVHVGGTRIAAGEYRLVWTNGLEHTDVLVSVNGRHVSFPATVKPDATAGGESVLMKKDGSGYALMGFRVKGLLILVHERR